jgi:mRNA interferase MazF
MTYRFGDVVLLDYPFTDGIGSKRRPGLVLLPESDGDILFARITSQERADEWEVSIEDRTVAGLLHKSVVRMSKMVSLESSLVERKIGRLSEGDQSSVQAAFELLAKAIRA